MRRRGQIHPWKILGGGIGGGAGGAFAPDDVSGLEFWVDFLTIADLYQDSAGTTPVAIATDPIGKATDLSGNGRHAVQATGAKRPTWGSSIFGTSGGAVFAGGQNLTTSAFSISQPTTLIVVGVSDGGGGGAFVDGVASRQAILISGSLYQFAGNLFNVGSPDGNAHLWAALYNGASSKFWNGGGAGSVGDAGTGAMGTLRIGNDQGEALPLTGKIGAVLLYSGAVATSDLDRIGDYYSTRTSIAWSPAS